MSGIIVKGERLEKGLGEGSEAGRSEEGTAGGDNGVRKLDTLPNTSKHFYGLVSLGGRGKVSITDGVVAGGLVWS